MLDAVEVSLMAEGGPVAPCLLVPDLSTPCLVVKHSTVENILDMGVILFVNVLRREPCPSSLLAMFPMIKSSQLILNLIK